MTRAQKNRAKLVAALVGAPVLLRIGILAIAGGIAMVAAAAAVANRLLAEFEAVAGRPWAAGQPGTGPAAGEDRHPWTCG